MKEYFNSTDEDNDVEIGDDETLSAAIALEVGIKFLEFSCL